MTPIAFQAGQETLRALRSFVEMTNIYEPSQVMRVVGSSNILEVRDLVAAANKWLNRLSVVLDHVEPTDEYER